MIAATCARLQYIANKKAQGEADSVQREVDGVVQQLRLHVSHLHCYIICRFAHLLRARPERVTLFSSLEMKTHYVVLAVVMVI